MGNFWYSHLSRVRTNSHTGAMVSGEQDAYPVVIYSHSFYDLNTENTMLMESLASHGYVVFSISHTYENIISVFPDGEAITGDLEHISGLYDSHVDREDSLYRECRNATSPDRKIELTRQILSVDELFTRFLKTRTGDVLFVMDELEKLNSSDTVFRSKLELQKIGIMGWSFGGQQRLKPASKTTG
jgi:predicted dienelactone hydrolase